MSATLLKTSEVAERLNCGETFVQTLCQKRKIRFHKLSRKAYRIPADALDEYLAKTTIKPRP